MMSVPNRSLRGGTLKRMPELTSLKVPVAVRDRFALTARARGVTVRALLEELSRKVADEMLMDTVAGQMGLMQETDPDRWREYLTEGAAWEDQTIEPTEP